MAPYGIGLGALFCALSVTAGAFGAHGLRARLDVDALALWETAARYLMYGGLALMAMGLYASAAGRRPLLDLAVVALFAGSLVFSGTVAALSLGGPRWLGAVTPIGGLLMILGLASFAVTALRWP